MKTAASAVENDSPFKPVTPVQIRLGSSQFPRSAGVVDRTPGDCGGQGKPTTSPPRAKLNGRVGTQLLSLSDLTERERLRLSAAFWSKVRGTASSCFEWTGALNSKGYGNVGVPRHGVRMAHRVAWLLTWGEIPAGLVLDHTCRNPKCVRPDHLEAVTDKENTRRGLKVALRTECKRGHAVNGPGRCRECGREYQRNWKRQRRAA